MQLDFALLADSAQVVQGKLYALGGAIDRIWVKEVPSVYPKLALVMRFILSPAELERAHQLEVVLMDDDGKAVRRFGGQLKVDRRPAADAWRNATPMLALDLMGIKFERIGNHAIEILVNGTSVKSLPLELVQQASPDSSPGGSEDPSSKESSL